MQDRELHDIDEKLKKKNKKKHEYHRDCYVRQRARRVKKKKKKRRKFSHNIETLRIIDNDMQNAFTFVISATVGRKFFWENINLW